MNFRINKNSLLPSKMLVTCHNNCDNIICDMSLVFTILRFFVTFHKEMNPSKNIICDMSLVFTVLEFFCDISQKNNSLQKYFL